MASVFVIKAKMENPMEWYAEKMKCNSGWEFDEQLKAYHLGSVYMKQCDNMTTFEDLSENEFFAWETSAWIALADSKELIYGFYNDSGNAEFIHIKNGICIREYRMCNFEVDTDKGDTPRFEEWTDVCDYIDDNLL